MIEELAELGSEIVGVMFDWLLGGDHRDDEPGEQPRPVPETLYEERRPPPDMGTS